MPRDNQGNVSWSYGQPTVAANEIIESTWANTMFGDTQGLLTDSLSRTGLGTMLAQMLVSDYTAPIPGANKPHYSFTSESTLGFYRDPSVGGKVVFTANKDLVRLGADADGDGQVEVYNEASASWGEVIDNFNPQEITGAWIFNETVTIANAKKLQVYDWIDVKENRSEVGSFQFRAYAKPGNPNSLGVAAFLLGWVDDNGNPGDPDGFTYRTLHKQQIAGTSTVGAPPEPLVEWVVWDNAGTTGTIYKSFNRDTGLLWSRLDTQLGDDNYPTNPLSGQKITTSIYSDLFVKGEKSAYMSAKDGVGGNYDGSVSSVLFDGGLDSYANIRLWPDNAAGGVGNGSTGIVWGSTAEPPGLPPIEPGDMIQNWSLGQYPNSSTLRLDAIAALTNSVKDIYVEYDQGNRRSRFRSQLYLDGNFGSYANQVADDWTSFEGFWSVLRDGLASQNRVGGADLKGIRLTNGSVSANSSIPASYLADNPWPVPFAIEPRMNNWSIAVTGTQAAAIDITGDMEGQWVQVWNQTSSTITLTRSSEPSALHIMQLGTGKVAAPSGVDVLAGGIVTVTAIVDGGTDVYVYGSGAEIA